MTTTSDDTEPLFEFDESIRRIPLSSTINRVDLEKTFGWFDGVSIIIGITIGSGIFASPGPILELTNSVGAALCVWM